MSYSNMIASVIGTNDHDTLALVEEIMREGMSGLDGLTRAQFDRLARHARLEIQVLRGAGLLTEYCDGLGLAVPTA